MTGSSEDFQILDQPPHVRFSWLLGFALACAAWGLTALLDNEGAFIFGDMSWDEASDTSYPPGEYSNRGQWRDVAVARQAIWVKANFRLESDGPAPEDLAVRLAGPFSARVWINGVYAGEKGAPGLTAEEERPGPIDALISLRPGVHGDNQLIALVSSFHGPDRAPRLFQDLSIEPYSSVQKRPAARYLTGISQAGIAILLVLALIVSAIRKRDHVYWLAGAAALMLLLALAAETSRAVVNYPYPFHGFRMFALWAATVGFGISAAATTMVRFTDRVLWPLIIGAALIALGARLLMAGGNFDLQSLIALAGAAAIAVIVLWRPAWSGDILARYLLATIAVGGGFALADPWLFLDNGLFPIGVLLLAPFAANIAGRRSDADLRGRIAIRVDGEQRTLGQTDVIGVAAAGNYAEITVTSGERLLVRAALASIADALKRPFVRVHRSHIVNLDHAKKLRSKPGSRYVLEMTKGGPVPVSRKHVAALRAELSRR